MKAHAGLQLGVVIWMCSSTLGRMAAPGMRGLVNGQLREVNWVCFGGRSTMAALTGSIGTPGELSKSLECLSLHNASINAWFFGVTILRRSIGTPDQLSNHLDWLEPLPTIHL